MEPTQVAREWGANIRAQRALLGKTQAELAAAIDVSQRAVSNWERGTAAPSLRHQMALARELRCSPRALFTFPQVAA